MEYARVFLGPGVHSDQSARLKKAFVSMIALCRKGLDINEGLINVDQREYQSDMSVFLCTLYPEYLYKQLNTAGIFPSTSLLCSAKGTILCLRI